MSYISKVTVALGDSFPFRQLIYIIDIYGLYVLSLGISNYLSNYAAGLTVLFVIHVLIC